MVTVLKEEKLRLLSKELRLTIPQGIKKVALQKVIIDRLDSLSSSNHNSLQFIHNEEIVSSSLTSSVGGNNYSGNRHQFKENIEHKCSEPVSPKLTREKLVDLSSVRLEAQAMPLGLDQSVNTEDLLKLVESGRRFLLLSWA